MTQVVVVNKGKENEDESDFAFKLLFKPLIPIGHETLSTNHPQINAQLVTNLCMNLECFLRNKAESIVKQQHSVSDAIKEVDFAAAFLANSVIAEKQRRISKVIENFQKLTEIEKLIKKCEEDLKGCVEKIEALNDFLPSSLKLESFEAFD